jgi:hypothetical protein
MKIISASNAIKLCLIIGLSSCASGNPGVETDDLYYTSDDRGRGDDVVKQQKQEVQREKTKVKETEPAKSDKNNYDFNSKP